MYSMGIASICGADCLFMGVAVNVVGMPTLASKPPTSAVCHQAGFDTVVVARRTGAAGCAAGTIDGSVRMSSSASDVTIFFMVLSFLYSLNPTALSSFRSTFCITSKSSSLM